MTVGVVGTGRFGRFWAELLAGRHRVLTYNRSPRPVPEGCIAVEFGRLSECDAVFLCVAISSMEPVVRRLSAVLREGSVLLDTCSVKVFPVEVMRRFTPETVQCIGCHPMFGPDSARNGVEGLPLVYCPVRCTRETEGTWLAEFSDLGLAVRKMTPEDHDREAAFTQGITHFIGRVLADLDLQASDIATVGYTQLLSVMEQTCNDPYQLFEDLQRLNPFTNEMRKRLQASLNRLLESLETRLDTDS